MSEQSFYSMDRLMEFGMGMAMAQQMTQMMNETMANVRVPGAQNPMARQSPERVYYVALEGKQAGPFSETEVARLIADKKVTKETQVWHPGLPAWKTVEQVPEVLRLVALAPPVFDTTNKGAIV